MHAAADIEDHRALHTPLRGWKYVEKIKDYLRREMFKKVPIKAEEARYRVSHGIGPTLFFAILSVSSLPKYKNLVSVKKFRKFAIR